MVDPIADLLTRIRNAQMARNMSITLPYSKVKHEIGKVMQKNSFIAGVEKQEGENFPELVLHLTEKKLELKRVSKCGQRIYTKYDEIRKVKNGFGIAIISTSKGIMTGYEARSLKLGGEYLCEVS